MEYIRLILIAYLCVVNIVAFAMFGIDKKRARKHQWRISEKALFISAIIGGSIGALLGMHIFRHKTKHWYFVIGIPVILIIQIACAVYAIKFLNIL